MECQYRHVLLGLIQWQRNVTISWILVGCDSRRYIFLQTEPNLLFSIFLCRRIVADAFTVTCSLFWCQSSPKNQTNQTNQIIHCKVVGIQTKQTAIQNPHVALHIQAVSYQTHPLYWNGERHRDLHYPCSHLLAVIESYHIYLNFSVGKRTVGTSASVFKHEWNVCRILSSRYIFRAQSK